MAAHQQRRCRLPAVGALRNTAASVGVDQIVTFLCLYVVCVCVMWHIRVKRSRARTHTRYSHTFLTRVIFNLFVGVGARRVFVECHLHFGAYANTSTRRLLCLSDVIDTTRGYLESMPRQIDFEVRPQPRILP